MAHEKLKPTYTFVEQKIKAIKHIVPEAFEDGKINFHTLRECLGDEIIDDDEDKFGLIWPGKKIARRAAAIPPEGTLAPVYGEGLKADGTSDEDGFNDSKNIFIEGENLEVLKILQKSYAGRIKMIYIDPPYNTGNDFVYDDNFTEPIEHYLRRTEQIDDEGRALTTNKKSDGRFHSKWLSMMYPRLKLARELLKEDGIIFVSIDDNEVHHLRQIMNEIFGEENFIEEIIWKNKYGAGAKTRGFISVHEYLLLYGKNQIDNLSAPLVEEEIKKHKRRDDKFDLRGGYRLQPLQTRSLGDRPNLIYPILYNNHEIWPNKQWVWSKERMDEQIALGNVEIQFKKDKFSVDSKQYLKDENGKMRRGKPVSTLIGPYTQNGTKEIRNYFDGKDVFDFPKPSELLLKLMEIEIGDSKEDDILVDFFSGSGSFAEAVCKYNEKYDVNCKFLCVQIPEKIEEKHIAYKVGYRTITQVTKERIRKSLSSKSLIDSGFKVFKLQSSQMNDSWHEKSSELQFGQDYFSKKELLFELIITEGFPLDSKFKNENSYLLNEIKSIQSDFHEYKLLICLDDNIEDETIKNLDLTSSNIFICFDHAITDQDKIRLSDKGLIKTIL